MKPDFWSKQDPSQPLYPDMLWSRPENRLYAGKLVIIGGSKQGFSAPAEAYTAALAAGVGVARVLLPDSLSRLVSKLFPEAEFAPSTPIGSFAIKALGEITPLATWSDGVLLAGDFGKNSETYVLLDRLREKYSGQLTIAGDAIQYVLTQAEAVTQRPETTLVMDFADLQKLISAAKTPIAVTSNMDILRFVEVLHELSNSWRAHIIVKRDATVFVAANGTVTSTESSGSLAHIAASASVWWLQNPQKPLQALTTSLVE